MKTKPDSSTPPPTTIRRAGLVRRLLPVLLGLTVLAVGINAVWWLSVPSLEPLPSVETDAMTQPVRELIQEAARKVMDQNRSIAAWGDLGAVFLVHDMVSEAAVCFRNAERLDPLDYRWPYLLGISLVYIDQDQTLAAYRRAAQRCGNKAHVPMKLAEMLLDQGNLDEAAELVEGALAYAPSDPHVAFVKARLLMAQGDLEQALTWARRSASEASEKRAPHLLVAQLCRRTKDSAGEATALKALERIPDAVTFWDDPDRAAIAFLRQDQNARLVRAENQAKSGQTAILKDTLRELSAQNEGTSATARLASILDAEGNFAAAETLLRNQLRDKPKDELLQFMLGNACFQQRQYGIAEAEFRRAIELKPDYADAWFNLGLTLLMVQKPQEAREAFAMTVHLDPNRAQARISLAELLLAEGKRESAIEHLQAALRLAPDEPRARELLARVKAAGG